VWNAVIPERVGMLCANCFIRHAEHIGFQCTGWELRPENNSEQASHADPLRCQEEELIRLRQQLSDANKHVMDLLKKNIRLRADMEDLIYEAEDAPITDPTDRAILHEFVKAIETALTEVQK